MADWFTTHDEDPAIVSRAKEAASALLAGKMITMSECHYLDMYQALWVEVGGLYGGSGRRLLEESKDSKVTLWMADHALGPTGKKPCTP